MSPRPQFDVDSVAPRSTRSFDLVRKREDYDRLGIPEFWVFDPDTAAAFIWSRDLPAAPYRLRELDGAAELTSTSLPGLRIAVASLFRR